MKCPQCDAEMTGPKYLDNGFRFFHCYECPTCGHEVREQRPHAEWEENQEAMRQLDGRKHRSHHRPPRADSWQRMCLGKRRYPDEGAANKTAAKFSQRTYFCPFCSGYHCTKKPLDPGPTKS